MSMGFQGDAGNKTAVKMDMISNRMMRVFLWSEK